jgi:uncharacterized membrane protein YdbT with pleckstrin-like domain
MSPAGSTSDTSGGGGTTLRPQVAKTFVKGLIAIGVFSLFLEVSPANFLNYLIFLGLSIGVLVFAALSKRASTFRLEEGSLTVKRFLQRPTSIAYQDIADLSVGQGLLAKRFGCGTVYLILKSGRGSMRVVGGGAAERLDDVKDPFKVYEELSGKLSPFTGSP